MAGNSAPDISKVVRDGLSKSLASLAIKVTTAGLTYLMFVALSRAMGTTAYGQFAFGFALATLLAIPAGLGQQTAILRFWHEARSGKDEDRPGSNAIEAVRAGGGLTLIGGMVIALGLCVAGAILGAVEGAPHGYLHYFGAAALVIPIALAEYFSAALRAQGSVWLALVPRDMLWRIGILLGAWGAWATGLAMSGAGALAMTALVLVGALGLQFALATRRYTLSPRLSGIKTYWQARGAASRWFLVNAFVGAAALNADTIIVGALIDAESAGLYFNAYKTAGLITLFAFAITLVIGPLISRHFHAGEMRKAQAIIAAGTWAGFAFALLAFVGFVLFGDLVMTLFGPQYAEAAPLLVVLSAGLLADAAMGPSRMTMMMTGHEKRATQLYAVMTLAGIGLQIAALPLFGLMGVAVVNALARTAVAAALCVLSVRRVGLDPTIMGILRINRPALRDRAHASLRMDVGGGS